MNRINKIVSFFIYFFVFVLIVPGVHYFLGFAIDKLIFNPLSVKMWYLNLAGIILICLGTVIILIAVLQLWFQGKGLPVSSIPPKILVKDGLYKLSRHPIYFGTIICYSGICIISYSFWNLVLSLPLLTIFFFVYATFIEEPILLTRYGEKYIRYKKSVFFFPSFFIKSYIKDNFRKLLNLISNKVNRPLIFQYQNHIFFIGYGIWCAVGVTIGLIFLNIFLSRAGITRANILILLFSITVTSLLAIYAVWIESNAVLKKRSVKSIIGKVGFVSWGVLIAALLNSIIFILLTNQPVGVWLDSVLLSLMITHFFGRIGCTFYGCCYGKESDSKLHICYRHAALKAVRERLVNPDKLYPVQLYSSAYGLYIFLLVTGIWLSNTLRLGLPATLVTILYSLFRFSEEWMRTQKKLFFNLLSPAQIVCVLLLSVGLINLFLMMNVPGKHYYSRILMSNFYEIIYQINIPFILLLGFITVIVFSYHRNEIGTWVTK